MIKTVTIILVIGFIFLIISLFKSGQPFRNALTNALQGVLSLIAVNVAGLLTGITLSVNWYTLAFAAAFGMPATIALTVLKLIFR